MKNFLWIPISNFFEVKVNPHNKSKQPSNDILKRVDEIWEQEKKSGRLLFDGELFCADIVSPNQITGHFIPYKWYLAYTLDNTIKEKLPLIPISISGYTRTEHHLLIGKRSHLVTQYQEHYELVPSGGISPQANVNDQIDLSLLYEIELLEEAGFHSSVIKEIKPFALIHDILSNSYEICSEIMMDYQELLNYSLEEYSELLWLPFEDIPAFIERHHQQFVPLSIYLINKHKV